MFSTPKKFFKKNMLLIGIILIVILMATYFVFMYTFKEGFDGPLPTKAKLIPVSTIDKFYNKLTDPNAKNMVAPIVELYKLFVANYDDVFATSLQIIDMPKGIQTQEIPAYSSAAEDAEVQALQMKRNAMQAKVDELMLQRDELIRTWREDPTLTEDQRTQTPMYQKRNQLNDDMDMLMAQIVKIPGQQNQVRNLYREKYKQDSQKARDDVDKKWASKINPGLIRVLSNAIKWLPTAKRYYDNFVSNNYYGLMPSVQPSPSESLAMQQLLLTIMSTLINTLYEDDQLSIILGPAFAKSNPNPPMKFPVNYEQFVAFLMNTPRETMIQLEQSMVQYSTNVAQPFLIIQSYLTFNFEKSVQGTLSRPGVPQSVQVAQGLIQNNVITDTIIQLIEQLNNAVANDATDQATIGQLTGKLNTALANDATDQATITNLQGKIQTQQSNSILNVGTNVMPTWATSSTTNPPTITSPSTAATSSSPASWATFPATTPIATAPPSKGNKLAPKARRSMWG